MRRLTRVDGARLESRLDHCDARADHGGNVEAHLEVPLRSKLGKPHRSKSTDASLLLPIDRTFGATELAGRPRLHLAEHEEGRSRQDEVDLTAWATPIATDQRVAVLCVPPQRLIFTESAARLRGERLGYRRFS